jgi:hypothetical protein
LKLSYHWFLLKCQFALLFHFNKKIVMARSHAKIYKN